MPNFASNAGSRLALTCHAVPIRHFLKHTIPQALWPEKILTARSDLAGERKQVTVLFADLKGSLELIADRDPEEARQLLDPVLEHLMVAVHRYEGTGEPGHGRWHHGAVWGARGPRGSRRRRACYAALAIQAALRRYGEEVRRTHGLAVQSRDQPGDVVVLRISNDLHMDYSAIGWDECTWRRAWNNSPHQAAFC